MHVNKYREQLRKKPLLIWLDTEFAIINLFKKQWADKNSGRWVVGSDRCNLGEDPTVLWMRYEAVYSKLVRSLLDSKN